MNEGVRLKVDVVGAVIVKDQGKYLLVQEGQADKGKWNAPAGKVDIGFTIEETAVKEAKEESGYDVQLIKKLDIWHDQAGHSVKHVFTAKIIGGEKLKANEEIMDVQWFTIDAIRAMKEKLRSPWVLQAIEMVEKQ